MKENKPKILIIDDEDAVLKMYKEKLDRENFETITASNAESGIEMAKEQKPDLILLDIIMPNYNGLDALKDLKSFEETKEIPVYLLTNLPEECSEKKCKELGADGYLVKADYEPQMVAKVLKKFFRK